MAAVVGDVQLVEDGAAITGHNDGVTAVQACQHISGQQAAHIYGLRGGSHPIHREAEVRDIGSVVFRFDEYRTRSARIALNGERKSHRIDVVVARIALSIAVGHQIGNKIDGQNILRTNPLPVMNADQAAIGIYGRSRSPGGGAEQNVAIHMHGVIHAAIGDIAGLDA